MLFVINSEVEIFNEVTIDDIMRDPASSEVHPLYIYMQARMENL